MAGRFLSGEELFHQMRPGEISLPEKSGDKDYSPDGSWLQEKKLETFLRDRHLALQEERIKKIGSLAISEWNQESGQVKLIKEAGKFLQFMGHSKDGANILEPEEALLLMEEGQLEVNFGGVPCSIQQVYTLLASTGMPLDHYLVYSHLVRMGFIVNRSITPMTKYESQLGIQYTTKPSKRQRKRRKKNFEEKPNNSILVTELKKPKLDDNLASHSAEKSHDNVDVSSDHPTEDKATDTKNSSCTEPPVNKCLFFSPCDSGSLTFGPYTVPVLPVRSAVFGEGDKMLDHSMQTSSETKKKDCEKAASKLSADKTSLHLPSSCMVQKGRHWLRSKNWAEHKQRLSQMTEEDLLHASPVGHLWSGPVVPLVTPRDAVSIENILTKLDIIKEKIPENSIANARCDVPVVLDVHLPDKHFRKTEERVPNHRVCITSQDNKCCDDLASLAHKWRVSSDGVPVHWAVVDNGEIAFYSFTDCNLPTDIS